MDHGMCGCWAEDASLIVGLNSQTAKRSITVPLPRTHKYTGRAEPHACRRIHDRAEKYWSWYVAPEQRTQGSTR